ncbi:MAG TPA: glycosyltransferase [Pyrinomonadaceae bacterium]|jgi:glycosyltransferase involved in cell wall biosynthesis|nr:glycosyltransferase [Pyrinomonadaceae bacterium]
MIVVLVHARFAPMHIAGLKAATALGCELNRHLVGVEVAATQNDYKWPRDREPGRDAQLRTLFPDGEYWSLSYKKIRRALHRALNDIAPDVVVLPGWGFKETRAGLGWCIKRGVPRVVISDSQPATSLATSPAARGKLWLKRLMVSNFQAGLAGGQPHARYLCSLGLAPERCFVGCDVVDNDFFARESLRSSINRQVRNRVPLLLSCLRLMPEKNITGVLEVIARHSGWNWMIAGDGSERAEIERRIETLGLKDRVRLLGHVEYQDLPRIYSEADAYLQPSLSDTWGLAVNEAMACGLPVIVSNRCGCHEDLVRDGVNGFTFDPSGPESLSAALDRLLARKSDWEEMGQASREIIDAWGPELFAKNFWRACDAALLTRREGRRERFISRALSFAL